MAKAEPNAGDIPITLAGKEHTLKPTLEACIAISRLGSGGGAVAVIQRVRSLDFETIAQVVALGTGYTSAKQRQELNQAIFEAGTISIAAEVILFIRVVNNGGQIPNDDDQEGEGGRNDPLP